VKQLIPLVKKDDGPARSQIKVLRPNIESNPLPRVAYGLVN
jgi:hypothetical protein